MKYPMQFLTGMLMLGLLSPVYATKRSEIIELDRIVAIVERDVITINELREKIEQVRRRFKNSNTPLPEQAILEKQMLERMILDEIQLQLAHDSGIRVDDEQLNRVIGNIASQNGMQLEQFRQAIEKDGVPFKKFREDIRKEIIISQLRRNKVENHVLVSEQEVDNQLTRLENQLALNNEYHLGHILIAVPESARPEQIEAAKHKAEEISTKLKLGADFKQTAISVSDGQQALQGGDLGWIQQGQLPTIFADIIPKLKPGELTPPVHSPSGFHIVKVLDVRSKDQTHMVKQTLARHILIRTSTLVTNNEAKNKLERIYQRILNGDDFGEIAKASSDDTVSAVDGGNLGWTEPSKLVPEFQEVMNRLNPGEVSKPFESRYGWHIVQVLSRRDHDDTSNYMRNQARQQIHKRKVEEETENWLRRIRDSAYVEYRLNE